MGGFIDQLSNDSAPWSELLVAYVLVLYT